MQNTPQRPDDLLCPAEVARIIGISRDLVYALLSAGDLRGTRVGRLHWRIKRKWVDEYIEANVNSKGV